MNLAALTVAAGLLAVAVLFHHYGWFRRPTIVLFAVAAAAATLIYAPFLDALAGLTATGKGLDILEVATLILFVLFLLETLPPPAATAGRLRNVGLRLKRGGKPRPVQFQRRKRTYERLIGPVIAILFGSCALLVAGNRYRLLSNTGKSAKQTANLAGSAIAQIQSGKAAHMVPQASRVSIALTGLALLLAAIIALWTYERRRLRREGKIAPKAVKGNAGGKALPGSGRPPIESGVRG